MGSKASAIIALGLLLVVGPSVSAQQIAWSQRISADVPAGVGLRTITPSARDPAAHLSIAVVTYSTLSDWYQYRVIATDPSSGGVRWTHDFGTSCAYRDALPASTARLAGDDIAVVVHGQNPSTNFRRACIVRLRATDGGLVWSRNEQDASGHLSIHAMSARGNGHLLLAGRSGSQARIQAWNTATGATLWQRDIGEPGSLLQAVAIADGSANAGAIHLQVTTGATVSSRLVGLDLEDGSTTWSRAGCASGARFFVDGQQWQSRLRMFEDGTLVHVLECYVAPNATTIVGRFGATGGDVVWQRELLQSRADAIIRDDRDVLLAGSLVLEGATAGLARLSGIDGSTVWSGPRGGTRYRMSQADGRVFVLEIEQDVSGYVETLRLASHDLASGASLANVAVEGLPDLMLADRVHIGAFADGDVLVAAMSGANRSAGSRFVATRLRPGESAARWLGTTAVMAPYPFLAQAHYAVGRQMSVTGKGGVGVVMSGTGTKGDGDVYPRAVKVDARNGLRMWAWQPDGRLNHTISTLIVTTDGDVVVAGGSEFQPGEFLLERLDGATGAAIWAYPSIEAAQALDAALVGDDLAVVSLQWPQRRIARHSLSTGQRLWDVGVPRSNGGSPADQRLLVHSDQSITLIGRGFDPTSGQVIHAVRFRGADGSVLWDSVLPTAPVSVDDKVKSVILSDGDLVIHAKGEIWRVDGGSGLVEWHAIEPLIVNAMVVEAGDVFVSGYAKGRAVACLRGSDGVVMWMRHLAPADPTHPGETLTAMSLGVDGALLVAGGDGVFGQSATALDPVDGSVRWQIPDSTALIDGDIASMSGSNYWPVGILQGPDGNVFYGGNLRPFPETWTLVKATGPFADGIYADGFE